MSKRSIGIFLIAGCGKSMEKKAVSEKPEASTLVLFNWEDYIGAKTLKNFKKETGITVEEVFFADEEDMLGAVQSRFGVYDLVVTSDDTIREMIEGKMLEKLDFSKIPNIKNIDNQYLYTPWDPNREYAVPYLAGSTGMVV